MDPQEYEIMYRVEDSHWWYAGMEAITRTVLRRWYRPGQGLKILDAGCGTGAAMTSYLAEYGKVTGFDLSMIGLGFCKRRKAELLACASGTALPFAKESFDLVTSFDVLYERAISSDAEAVLEAWRVLRPGGRMLIRLPAYEWMKSTHDKAVHTARRYTAAQVKTLLCSQGFALEQLSYANTFLFPLAALVRMIKRGLPNGTGRSDLDADPGILNDALGAVLSAEAPLVAKSRLPFGLSVVAVGRKKPTT